MRIINFFDGAQSETTPVIGNVIAANLVQYPNDAAYEANEDGAPQTGNLYYNTTLNLIRYYNGTEWITLVDESSAQTLEQKTIDADLNTITNIENENIKAGAGIDVTKLHDGSIDNTEFGYLNGVTSNIQDQLNDKQDLAEKGQPNGYASLDGAGLVPAGQLPSYVDDVLEYANLASFPVSGETGKIYVAIDTSNIYRWSGTMYVQISASGANQELSNLTPTSINQDLLPDTTATRSLGSTSEAWDGVHLRTSDAANGVLIEGTSSAGSQQLLVTSNPTDVPSGATNGVHIQGRSLGEKLAIATRTSTSATASSDLLLESGNNTSTGNSGNVSVRTGTVVSGTRGKFQIRDGTEGTVGHVWTSTDTNGNGRWAENIVGSEILTVQTAILQAFTGNANTFYVPLPTFKLDLTPGTWNLRLQGYTDVVTNAGNARIEMALSTSTTPGVSIFAREHSSGVSDTTNGNRGKVVIINVPNYAVVAPVSIYVHVYLLNTSGFATSSLAFFGSIGNSNSKLSAIRIR